MKKLLTSLVSVMLAIAVCFTLTACKNDTKVKKVNVDIGAITYGIAVSEEYKTQVNDYINGIPASEGVEAVPGVRGEIEKALAGTTAALDTEGVVAVSVYTLDASDYASYLIVALCVDADNPYAYIDISTGKYAGAEVTVAKAIAKKLGKSGIAVYDVGSVNDDEAVLTAVKSIADLGLNFIEISNYSNQFGVDMIEYYSKANHVLIVNAENSNYDNKSGVEIERALSTAETKPVVGVKASSVGANYIKSLGYGTDNVKQYLSDAEAVNAIVSGEVSVAIVEKATADALVESANASDTNWSTWIMFGILALLLVAFFVMSRRSNKKKKKETEDMMSKFGKGSYVKTIGGVMGKVVSINDNEGTFVIQTGNGKSASYMKFDKQAIYQVTESKKKDTHETEEVFEEIANDEPSAPETETAEKTEE